MDEQSPHIEQTETDSGSRFGVLVISLGVIWFGVLEVLLRWPQVGIWVGFGVAALLTFWTSRWRTRERSRWSLPLAVALISLTSFGTLIFSSNHAAQHLVAILSAVTLTSFLDQAQQDLPDELRGRLASFAMAVCLWFGWLTMLSAGTFLSLAWWWLVIGGAVLTTMVAVVFWLEAGIEVVLFRRWLPAFAWLGAEVMIVTWWLPTSVFVGSVVAATILLLFLQTCRHLWRGQWEPGRGRRYLVTGLTIICLVLLTARWI